MARRKSDNRREEPRPAYSRRKSEDEARVERITWFLLVAIFAVIYFIRDDVAQLPNWAVPMAGALVLLGSGLYQYSRRWRVSPVTWIIGVTMLFMVIFNFVYDPRIDMLGFSLIAFMVLIGFGILSGET
ncbi:MAG: hypothetical protein MUF87_13320 [Anaerolineae bacterium]|jgi:uncharacterized membrane protein YhaH (DUF805 family)|nr:hypothetical protein [Anaerolineae bacterium]